MFEDFKLEKRVEEDLIRQYQEKLPQEIIALWKDYGFGSFMGGYLRIINPDDYVSLVQESYFLAKSEPSVPVMVTAFGDVITWDKNEYVSILLYRNAENEIMIKTPKLFLRLLSAPDFQRNFFSIELYNQAVKRYGEPAYDECFGFYPILAMGGRETVESIQISKTREHIALITSLTDGIQ